MRSFKQLIFSLSLIAALFGWFGSVTSAFACSCAALTPSEQFSAATAVFVGTVKSITVDGGENLVDFEISELRKGSEAENIVVATNQQSSACGFNFMVGEEYVVYAYGEEGQLATGICSGTSSIMDKDFVTFTGFAIVVLLVVGTLVAYRRKENKL